jgi:hypothetical protein
MISVEPANFENCPNMFERWLDVRAIYASNPADQQIAIFFNDARARKRAEEELRKLNETLVLSAAFMLRKCLSSAAVGSASSITRR